jgi:hypothetical protein
MRMPSLHHKAEPPPKNATILPNRTSPHPGTSTTAYCCCIAAGWLTVAKAKAMQGVFVCTPWVTPCSYVSREHWYCEKKACGGPAQFGSTLLHSLALGGTYAARLLPVAARDKQHKPWPLTTLQYVTGNTPTETHTGAPFMACSVRLLHAIHQPNEHVFLCMQCSAVLHTQTNRVHPDPPSQPFH